MATEPTPSLDELIQRANDLSRNITAAADAMQNGHIKDTLLSAVRCADAAALRIKTVKTLSP